MTHFEKLLFTYRNQSYSNLKMDRGQELTKLGDTAELLISNQRPGLSKKDEQFACRLRGLVKTRVIALLNQIRSLPGSWPNLFKAYRLNDLILLNTNHSIEQTL